MPAARRATAWFVFPQLAGLGQSAMSKRFATGSLDEAGHRGVRHLATVSGANATVQIEAIDILESVSATRTSRLAAVVMTPL